MNARRAFTLIETLAATAIVVVIVVTLGLVLAPAARAKGIETRIRADLRQIVASMNLYMADNGGWLPLELSQLGASVPLVYPDWPERSPYSSVPTDGSYNALWDFSMQRIENKAAFKYPFDPAKNAAVHAGFYQRERSQPVQVEVFSQPGVSTIHMEKMPLVLGARLDGSVYWKPFWEPWTSERAASISLHRLP